MVIEDKKKALMYVRARDIEDVEVRYLKGGKELRIGYLGGTVIYKGAVEDVAYIAWLSGELCAREYTEIWFKAVKGSGKYKWLV